MSGESTGHKYILQNRVPSLDTKIKWLCYKKKIKKVSLTQFTYYTILVPVIVIIVARPRWFNLNKCEKEKYNNDGNGAERYAEYKRK